MLDKVIEHALKEYNGNEEAATSFVESFVKEAGLFGEDPMFKEPGFWDRESDSKLTSNKGTLTKGLLGEIGKGLGGVLVAGGATAAGTLYSMVRNSNQHTKFLQALEHVYNSNPIIRQAKKDVVLGYGETLFRFAPTVASDVNLLNTLLVNAIQGEGVDPAIIKSISDLEDSYKRGSSFSPKTYM